MVQRRQWQATPVLLPRKSHGWRSLVGCSPWGRYKLDATERLHFHFSCSQWRRQRQPTPVFLPGESQGRQSPVGCRLWGRTESDTTEATEQQQLLWLLSGKEYICQFRRRRFDPWSVKIPRRTKWQPTAVFLPGKSHGQRSLVGHSPWDGKRVGHNLVPKQQQNNNKIAK